MNKESNVRLNRIRYSLHKKVRKESNDKSLFGLKINAKSKTIKIYNNVDINDLSEYSQRLIKEFGYKVQYILKI